jgi:hypothetical protein
MAGYIAGKSALIDAVRWYAQASSSQLLYRRRPALLLSPPAVT